MCGICGIYNFKNKEPVSSRILKAMADTIVHRGPDDEGFHISGSLGLGHRRLSIIDIEGGHQPMANTAQNIWIVFNGEIYNFQELSEDLTSKGYTFKTRSDTEVIIYLYEEYGEKCFQYLNGMFSIAIWDGREKKLVLARDRVGKKPLFYYYDEKRIVFASEMKAILEATGIPRDIDLEALSDYFSFLYIPNPKSIFKKIRKVRPAHYMVISERGIKEIEYWDLSFANTLNISEKEWCERLLESYREAVQMRLISDVPLGAFLSGGVDSSSVVSIMSNLTNDPVITASIGFEEKEFDELDYANQIADLFKTNHYQKIVRPDTVNILEKLVWHYDEPFADSSSIPTYYVSKVARECVTVALSGDGGDENFAGYRRHYFDKRENTIRSFFPDSFRRVIFGTLAKLYPKADWAPRVFRGKATFENLARTHIEGYFRSMSAVLPLLKNKLLHPDVCNELGEYDSIDLFRYYYERADTDDPLSRIQYLDIKTYLTDDILVKVDRASMANSLEVRAPILDYRFMEMIAQIPSSMKLQGTNGKYILKKAFESILPHDILYRKKMGFAVPLAKWFRYELKDLAASIIFNPSDYGLLDNNTVKLIWNQHQRGLRDRGTELWSILMFKMWHQRFMNHS